MAKRKHRHRRQREGVIGPALRPVAWSALLSAAMTAVAAGSAHAAPPLPAYAEPNMPGQVPDAGARPQASGAVQLPGMVTPISPSGTIPVTSTALGPLAQKIAAAEMEVAGLGEQLKQLAIERQRLQLEVDTLNGAWQQARAALRIAEVDAKTAAEAAYKRAAELPPGAVDSDLTGLGSLSRLRQESPSGSEAQASQLKRAQEAEQTAYLAYSGALGRQRDTAIQYADLQTRFRQREAALLKLRKDNKAQLVEIEREREAQERRLAGNFTGGDIIDGLRANPKARQALEFAKNQLGEPYQWGAEGPSRWDCSGLMWGAYRSVGITLPRVSRDQFQATKTRQVSSGSLLPGDLLFFSSSPTDASKIHHVAMYVGSGKMIHAPTTGDVVRIQTVWWSRFFAATRVVNGVPAPSSTPSPTPKPTEPDPEPTTPKPKPTKPTSRPPVTKPTTPPPPTDPPETSTPPPVAETTEPAQPEPIPEPPATGGTDPATTGSGPSGTTDSSGSSE